MPAKKLTSEQAAKLLQQRFEAARERVTPEAIAQGHEWQLRVLKSKSQNLVCMCSRRAGKSEVACGLILMTAMATPGVSCLFLGLTKESAGTIWRKYKRLIKRLRVPAHIVDGDQVCILPNGSRVLFTGTDDVRRVSHLLGDQLSGGVAVLDECQSDPGILEHTVKDVLAPMLNETITDISVPGRLVMLGTVPDVPAGFFWRSFAENYTGPDITPTSQETAHWGLFAWSRFDNPHETENERHLADYLKTYHYERSDPEVQRRWFGVRVFSAESNAYRFEPSKHTYAPLHQQTVDIGPFHCRFVSQLPGVSHYIVGIDQAQRHDRFAIVAWGWNPTQKDRLYHVAEAVTDPGGDPLESEWLAITKELRQRYSGSMEFIRDAGGSSAPVNDALQLSHGITVVSAIKGPGSLKARVQRLSDLLRQGVAKVIEGSELAGDMLTAKWSMAEREKGKWALDKSAKSPDLSDAATYALDLPSFTTRGAQPKQHKPGSEEEWLREQQAKTLRDLLSGKPQAKPRSNPALLMWSPPPKN